MEWLSTEALEEYARCPKSAIEGSILHHTQILLATPEQLEEGIKNSKVSVTAMHCSLCLLFRKEGESISNPYPKITGIISACSVKSINCPLWNKIDKQCCMAWWNVASAFSSFERLVMSAQDDYRPSSLLFQQWKLNIDSAEKVLIARLVSLQDIEEMRSDYKTICLRGLS